MKRILFLFLISCMGLLAVGCNAEAIDREFDYDSWVGPYQKIIDEINDENGWTLAIVDRELFYQTYKDCPLDETKDRIVETYLKALENDGQSDSLEISDADGRVIVSFYENGQKGTVG